MAVVTHAITIDAAPEQVWPWLAQMGAGRGGWYSYDRIDNGGRQSATSILPEYQSVVPGDVMPAIPGATDAFVVHTVLPPSDLVLTVPNPGGGQLVSWEFVLDRWEGPQTRLLVRGRVAPGWLERSRRASVREAGLMPIERVYAVLARIPRPIMLAIAALGHRLMEARLLRSVKRRVESSS